LKDLPSATIAEAIDVAAAHGIDARLYLFGSALDSAAENADVDFLIVYRDGELAAATRLADEIRRLDVIPPTDVVALSDSEEVETDFVGTEDAVLLWELRLGAGGNGE
jgi:homogentisate 1,2-dioxygenase